jgi:TolB protein
VDMTRQIKFTLVILLLAHVFSVRAGELQTPIAYLAYIDGYWQVWAMAADGTSRRQVTKSRYDKSRVSWYPNGKFLLVNGNQGELNRVNLSSGEETPMQAPLKGMNDAVVSPDGTQIAFSLSTSGSIDDNNIWLIDIDGKNQQKLTNMQGLQHEPVWSPDGKRLYFLSGKGGQVHDIWQLTLATRETEQLTTSSLYHFDVAVSPDGQIAFSNNKSGDYDIWIRDTEGELCQVTNVPGMDGKPAWSPNGKILIFESSRSGEPNLWKINLADGEPEQLTRHERGARFPVWYRASVDARP